MTKTSTILICPMVPLRQLPPAEREIVSRFLFQNIKGLDDQNNKRWKRLWSQIWNAEPGEGFQLYVAEERGGPFHRRHRVILDRLFDSQEYFTSTDALHDWAKLKCWFVEWVNGSPVPRSTSFEGCSESDIQEFSRKFFDELLQQSEMQEMLWPHLDVAKRQEMVESVIRNPNEVDQ